MVRAFCRRCLAALCISCRACCEMGYPYEHELVLVLEI
jgi:hypothetical protein